MRKSLFFRPLSWVVAALAMYWLALFVATHVPQLPKMGGVGSSDKTAHFLAYAGLSFLVAAVVMRRNRWSRGAALAVLLAVMAYGVIDELLQIPIPGRYADVWDWVFDCLGAVVGLIAFRAAQKTLALRREHLLRHARQVALERG